MIKLFSKQGEESLRIHLTRPNLFGFDLDGSLIAVKRNFKKVHIPAKTRKLLEELADRETVSVISGRSIKDLKRILKPVRNLNKIILIGNHGLEGLGEPPHSKMVADWKRELQEKIGHIPGVILEDKKITMTVHYRLVRHHQFAEGEILKALKKLKPRPRIILGEFVFNLLPDVGLDKGTALQRLMKNKKLSYSFYLGDDWTDEEVFKLKSKKIFKVRVKNSSKTQAKYYITKQTEIDGVLSLLLKTLNDK